MTVGEYIAVAAFAFTVLSACFTVVIKVWQSSSDSKETKQKTDLIHQSITGLREHTSVMDERHRLLIEKLDERQSAHEHLCTEHKRQLHNDLALIHEKVNRLK